MKTIYFFDSSHELRKLQEDQPVRHEGKILTIAELIKDDPCADCEIYDGGSWISGYVMGEPSRTTLTIEVDHFTDPKALNGAIRDALCRLGDVCDYKITRSK